MRRRTFRSGALVVLAALAGLSGQASPAAADDAGKPTRIVSLNLCTDELLLRLADRDRIASVTWLSQDSAGGNVADLARTVPANHGLVEEVLAARPDLVVAGRYTTRTAVALLKATGVRVVEFGAPNDLPAVRAQIRDFAAAVGESARGETLVSDMDRSLAAIDVAPGPRPGAFVLRPNGFTAGPNSLVDTLLTRAGLDNLGARLDLGAYGQVPLERVVLDNADILVVDGGPGSLPSLATAILDHPVLARLKRRVVVAAVPSRLWTCAGPSIVEAVRRLREAVREWAPPGADPTTVPSR